MLNLPKQLQLSQSLFTRGNKMGSTKFIIGMRDAFFNELYRVFKKDPNCVLITAENGAPTLDQFAADFPKQYYNVGIAEQQMMGMACGMAFEGKKVYTYAIAPFVSLRCYEQNKLDMCAMNLPIVNLGVGAGYAYDIMGPSHHTVEDISIMRALPNLVMYGPADSATAHELVEVSYRDPRPQYIRFDRSGLPELYQGKSVNISEGLTLTEGSEASDVTIIATGVMVSQALQVRTKLEAQGLRVSVVDLFRLKPLNEERLISLAQNTRALVTYEEHLLAGGMGSAVIEVLSDRNVKIPTLRIGQNDRFVFDYGGRQVIWEKYGLDAASVTQRTTQWLESEVKLPVLTV
jgi:transketolase